MTHFKKALVTVVAVLLAGGTLAGAEGQNRPGQNQRPSQNQLQNQQQAQPQNQRQNQQARPGPSGQSGQDDRGGRGNSAARPGTDAVAGLRLPGLRGASRVTFYASDPLAGGRAGASFDLTGALTAQQQQAISQAAAAAKFAVVVRGGERLVIDLSAAPNGAPNGGPGGRR